MSSKQTVASLAALVEELTTRLTAVEAQLNELKQQPVQPVQPVKQRVRKVKEPKLETETSDTEKKASNPTGPAAFNAFKTKFIQEHPDVPKDKQVYEATIAYRMEKDGVSREDAEAKFAADKAKRTAKPKKEKVVETKPVEVEVSTSNVVSSPEVRTQPLSSSSSNVANVPRSFEEEVIEKASAVKREINGVVYYIDNTNTALVFPTENIDSMVIVGKFDTETNSVVLNKKGRAYMSKTV